MSAFGWHHGEGLLTVTLLFTVITTVVASATKWVEVEHGEKGEKAVANFLKLLENFGKEENSTAIKKRLVVVELFREEITRRKLAETIDNAMQSFLTGVCYSVQKVEGLYLKKADEDRPAVWPVIGTGQISETWIDQEHARYIIIRTWHCEAVHKLLGDLEAHTITYYVIVHKGERLYEYKASGTYKIGTATLKLVLAEEGKEAQILLYFGEPLLSFGLPRSELIASAKKKKKQPQQQQQQQQKLPTSYHPKKAEERSYPQLSPFPSRLLPWAPTIAPQRSQPRVTTRSVPLLRGLLMRKNRS